MEGHNLRFFFATGGANRRIRKQAGQAHHEAPHKRRGQERAAAVKPPEPGHDGRVHTVAAAALFNGRSGWLVSEEQEEYPVALKCVAMRAALRHAHQAKARELLLDERCRPSRVSGANL